MLEKYLLSCYLIYKNNKQELFENYFVKNNYFNNILMS